MSKLVFFAIFLIFPTQANVHNRFKRQYWGGTPYYAAQTQYYETQPQQWSSQYQNNQNYYSPYFYGYQHQTSWQNSNQNGYQSSYNRPSWIGESSTGYATAPPDYNPQGGYARPKYLATMQPKPTLSPVVLERSTFYVTQQPEVLKTSTNGKHLTFLERLGVATLPVVPSSGSDEETSREKAMLKTMVSSENSSELDNVELLPGRSGEDRSEEENNEITSSSTSTIEEESSTLEPNVMEKDEIASSEIFGTGLLSVTTTEAQVETTTTIDESEITSTITEESTKSTTELTTEPTTTTETTTSTTTTTSPATTSTTAAPTTTTSAPTTTPRKTTIDVKPVTLLAFQEVTDEIVSSASNVTQPTVDQDTTDRDVTGEGSGSVSEDGRSTFSPGIVGLRSPPLPKTADPEKVGLEVVEWTDSDNEVRKALSQ